MNILYLAHRIPFPPNKGDKIRSFRQLDHLASRHRVWCACFVDSSDELRFVEPLRRRCEDVVAIPIGRLRARIRGLLGLLRGKTLTESYYRHTAMTLALHRWSESIKFDVAVAFSSGMAAYTQEVAADRRVLDFCDLDSQKWLDYAAKSRWPLRRLYEMEGRQLFERERYWANQLDAAMVITEAEGRPLVPHVGTGKVHVVGNGVLLGDRLLVSPERVLAETSEDVGEKTHQTVRNEPSRAREEATFTREPGRLLTGAARQDSHTGSEPRGGQCVDTVPHDSSVAKEGARKDSHTSSSGEGKDSRTSLYGEGAGDRSHIGVMTSGQPIIGFIGVMNYRPNVDACRWFVSTCWPTIRAASPQAIFRIIGRSPSRSVRRLGFVPGVEVVGEVDDVGAELAGLDVSVAPLRIARGLQNKVLEAMAATKPVVLSAQAATGIGARHGEDYLVADGEVAFSDAVIKLLRSPDVRRAVGLAGRRFVVQHHRWDEVLRQFEFVVTGVQQRSNPAGSTPVPSMTLATTQQVRARKDSRTSVRR